jgi:hypothetical protein
MGRDCDNLSSRFGQGRKPLNSRNGTGNFPNREFALNGSPMLLRSGPANMRCSVLGLILAVSIRFAHAGRHFIHSGNRRPPSDWTDFAGRHRSGRRRNESVAGLLYDQLRAPYALRGRLGHRVRGGAKERDDDGGAQEARAEAGNAQTPRLGAIRSCRKRDGFLVAITPGQHGPRHSCDLVGKRDRGHLGRAHKPGLPPEATSGRAVLSGIHMRPDCLPDDAVNCEPVSAPNFPNREINREFCRIRPCNGDFRGPINARIQ